MSLPEIAAVMVAAAAQAAGRDAGEVTLIAVSKLQPLDRLRSVLAQGHQHYGENYVQESVAKWPDLRGEFGAAIHVAMIGPLQTNKAKQAVELFDAIHSVDRPSLAQKLANLAQARGACPDLFVQVNTGAEPQKAGVLPADLDGFLAECRAMDLPISGLMCIPPDGIDPAPHFMMLGQMAAQNGLRGLSMGMSSDFATAIAHGATHIRVGSAIFGNRPVKAE
ncbi:MAG: YggS family pyridoxal phosphate-dependent enzyme [Cypionkella sp.]|nr:YggS family pyridoxal phosphate-dependent enzyme [Cypionkella sp.]